MDGMKYEVAQYQLSSILNYINSGDISIPDIQRPFVWKPKNVRDLIDSLYNGYPIGYIIIWQNPNVSLKDGSKSIGKKIIIDGQQRITALKTAILGDAILNEDFEEKVYKIAFNPLAKEDEEIFAVQTPAHVKSKHWIPDISVLFNSDFDILEFMEEYKTNNPDINPKDVNKVISKLKNIQNSQIGVINLAPGLDVGEVTEIFVRVNSQGKRLNEADFAMSKIAADNKYQGNELRKAIDYFCHLAVDPTFYEQLLKKDKQFMQTEFASKISWLKDDLETIYDPDYNDMLRVSFMHQFGRAKLGDLVNLLSGRDFENKVYKEEIAADSFSKLRNGILNFMGQYNLESFVIAIKSLGFISSKLLTSKMTLDFAYTLFLLLHNSDEIQKIEIKRYVQKWFLLSTLTGRYSTSPETQMDKDLRAIKTKSFKVFFEEMESSQLSDTFWDIGLVQKLEISSVNSPAFSVFLAAQIKNAETSLLSNSTKVADLITIMGDVHHIFPKEYLKENGITDKLIYNQVANFAYLDKPVNISIGKKSPEEYFRLAKEQCITQDIKVGTISNINALLKNLEENCIPSDIETYTVDDYQKFLIYRRKMMAKKIKDFYYGL